MLANACLYAINDAPYLRLIFRAHALAVSLGECHVKPVELAAHAFDKGKPFFVRHLRDVFRKSHHVCFGHAYAYLTRVKFVPDDIIAMRFGKDEVRVSGKNLYRLFETITEQRTRFIQEGADGEDGLKAADAAHVDEILITEGEES